MEYFIYHIEQAREEFGQDISLSHPKQVSIWSRQFLIQIIKQKGLTFNTAIDSTKEGKPFFLYNPNLHFSISHTKNYMGIALSHKPIGIDIEQERTYKKELVKRFFHPQEVEYLAQITNPQKQNQVFTKIWTLKESYVKCTGTGIANNFQKFYISLLDNQPKIHQNQTPVQIQTHYNSNHKLYISISEQL